MLFTHTFDILIILVRLAMLIPLVSFLLTYLRDPSHDPKVERVRRTIIDLATAMVIMLIYFVYSRTLVIFGTDQTATPFSAFALFVNLIPMVLIWRAYSTIKTLSL